MMKVGFNIKNHIPELQLRLIIRCRLQSGAILQYCSPLGVDHFAVGIAFLSYAQYYVYNRRQRWVSFCVGASIIVWVLLFSRKSSRMPAYLAFQNSSAGPHQGAIHRIVYICWSPAAVIWSRKKVKEINQLVTKSNRKCVDNTYLLFLSPTDAIGRFIKSANVTVSFSDALSDGSS